MMRLSHINRSAALKMRTTERRIGETLMSWTSEQFGSALHEMAPLMVAPGRHWPQLPDQGTSSMLQDFSKTLQWRKAEQVISEFH